MVKYNKRNADYPMGKPIALRKKAMMKKFLTKDNLIFGGELLDLVAVFLFILDVPVVPLVLSLVAVPLFIFAWVIR